MIAEAFWMAAVIWENNSYCLFLTGLGPAGPTRPDIPVSEISDPVKYRHLSGWQANSSSKSCHVPYFGDRCLAQRSGRLGGAWVAKGSAHRQLCTWLARAAEGSGCSFSGQASQPWECQTAQSCMPPEEAPEPSSGIAEGTWEPCCGAAPLPEPVVRVARRVAGGLKVGRVVGVGRGVLVHVEGRHR